MDWWTWKNRSWSGNWRLVELMTSDIFMRLQVGVRLNDAEKLKC